LSPTYTFLNFEKDIQEFIPQVKTNLCGESFNTPLAISYSGDAQHNVKRKLDFDELKLIFK
jgi:hypothetical protein